MSSLIASLHSKDASVSVEYPEIDGFMVDIKYVARDELMKIRKRCVTFKFSKKTRQREEDLDNDKFLKEYSKTVIKGWKGLRMEHLPVLLPVSLGNADLTADVPYSEEDALDLLKNSTVFDQFVTDTLNDFEKFSSDNKKEIAKN